jgi:putative ABC transport system substrate-binding protein
MPAAQNRPMPLRRRLLLGLTGFLLFGRDAEAQVAGRTYRLAVLRPTRPGDFDERIPAALADLGYVEGRNLVIDRRYAEDRPERLAQLARDIVAAGPGVILAVGSSSVQAAMAATRSVPIVMYGNFDPVAAGFVASLGRPGGNVTGALIAPDGTLAAKKIQLLLEAVPTLAHLGLLLPDDPGRGVTSQVREVTSAAAELGLHTTVVTVHGGDYERAFRSLAAAAPQALFVGSTTFFVRDRRRIIELAAQHRLPAMYEWREHVVDGGLMTYAPSQAALYRRVAEYIDRIFDGADPATLPVERPTQFELVINLKTARDLGLALPQSLLLRADELVR